MTTLRLIADDLTGALDTAAEFVGLLGPVPVYWSGAIPADLPPSAAVDSGTRELGRERGRPRRRHSWRKVLSARTLLTKKSTAFCAGTPWPNWLRASRAGPFRFCVVAPAFPYQGRVTRGGVQFRRTAGRDWSPVADLCALLAEAGLRRREGDPPGRLEPGITVFDAETDDDLRRVARSGVRQMAPCCGAAALG